MPRHSTVIECAVGDRVLKQGGVARNIFVVLDGTLEAHDGEQVVGVIRSGEVFGEMAYLLERPRHARRLRRQRLGAGAQPEREHVAEDGHGGSGVAAKLLFNISKMLCVRIVKAS